MMLIFRIILPFFLVSLCLGCGGKGRPADLPRLYPVKIELTQEGKPLVDAIVIMSLSTGNSKWPASGNTDSSGAAVMYVNGMYEGAPLGEFKVTVFKTKTDTPSFDEPVPTDPNELTHYNERRTKVQAQSKNYNFVEPIYNSAETTPLSVTVVKGENLFRLSAGQAVKMMESQRKID